MVTGVKIVIFILLVLLATNSNASSDKSYIKRDLNEELVFGKSEKSYIRRFFSSESVIVFVHPMNLYGVVPALMQISMSNIFDVFQPIDSRREKVINSIVNSRVFSINLDLSDYNFFQFSQNEKELND